MANVNEQRITSDTRPIGGAAISAQISAVAPGVDTKRFLMLLRCSPGLREALRQADEAARGADQKPENRYSQVQNRDARGTEPT